MKVRQQHVQRFLVVESGLGAAGAPRGEGGLVRKPGELGKQVADHLLGLGSPETH